MLIATLKQASKLPTIENRKLQDGQLERSQG